MPVGAFLSRIRQIMYNDGGVDTDEQRLRQITWLLFLRVFDYKEDEWEATKEDFKPTIPIGYRWRDWATGKSVKDQMTGDELLFFVNNKLFKVLSGDSIKDETGKEIFLFKSTTKQALLVKEFMRSSNNLMQNGVRLRQVINLIGEIDLNSLDDRHSFNDIYESLLKGLQKSCGGFYTGRALTSLIVDHVRPRIGEKIADFACGTGGFLIDVMKYLMAMNPNYKEEQLIKKNLYGVEKKKLPYILGVTNLILHDIENPNIIHGNTLDRDVTSYDEDEKFDVIVMNPPYGGAEEGTVLNNFPAYLASSETAELFMVEIMYRLKRNGRCGVILPDGFLNGNLSSEFAIRSKLINEFNLHTVIRLPESCFAPYTSIPTNILFFDNTERKTSEVWFYRVDLKDGQKFSLVKNPMLRSHFECVDEWWDNRHEIMLPIEDSEDIDWKSKRVHVDEIADNDYSLDYCGFPIKKKVVLSPMETINDFKKKKSILERKLEDKLSKIITMLNMEEEC